MSSGKPLSSVLNLVEGFTPWPVCGVDGDALQDSVGPPGTKAFCVPRFLITGNRLAHLPGPSLSSNEQVETGANLERGGMQRQGKSSQETITQPRDRA